MVSVFLHDLRFHALQGMFDEEHSTGNELSVSVEISYNEKEYISSIEQTINYSDVFDLVRARIYRPGKLLETLAMDLCAEIKNKYPQTTEINISISKLQAPILNFQGQAGIRFQKKFDDLI